MNDNVVIISLTATVILFFALAYFLKSGFGKRRDVVLFDYSISEDGTKLIFNAGLISSMGYIRGFKDDGGGADPHILTFYSTFGGLNSPLGAKNAFEIDLSEKDTAIYFNRTEGSYELVLRKNAETGEWEKPKAGFSLAAG